MLNMNHTHASLIPPHSICSTASTTLPLALAPSLPLLTLTPSTSSNTSFNNNYDLMLIKHIVVNDVDNVIINNHKQQQQQY